MFYFRINKLKIVDNRENCRFLHVFGSDAAEVRLNSFITTDETRLPNMDEMIGVLCMSLNRLKHYRHGERKRDNVPDLTNNMFVDYSIFGFDLVPRRSPLAPGRIYPRPITVRNNV